MKSVPLFEEAGTLMPKDIYQPLNNSLKTLEILHLKQTTYSQDKVRFKQAINNIFELIITIQTPLRFVPWIHLFCCADFIL